VELIECIDAVRLSALGRGEEKLSPAERDRTGRAEL
jgi:hypothetical protein